VAVLPEAEEVDVQIKTEDLKFDVFRASGAGGQHVNTTDSAVRVTHIPSGVSVESQQERSQHRNREIALRILRSRMLEAKVEAEQAAYAAERKSQVGSGDRSERIRTYNFPQNRVTDHRYGLSWYNLPGTLDGDITDMLEAILAKDSIAKLEEQLNDT
jgi:peptide chain release factor 1